ncbi:sugar transferase [Aurantiacibacter spongiae]|uniref:Sugar transferase n=1 Tax=Aurantiacibacter spongiae TaxID=2488860 RepID=A0A3N5CQ54_9SPHN|nr:sugar transferase [Aurantiacibacter spongiae]RPF71173.1 sugar transferase [Aurantiacibacter spongiae]
MTLRVALEAVLAALLLVLLAPVLLATALAVRLALGRGVLFRQTRSGLGGVPFLMIKFRTMTDARDAQGNLLPDPDRTPALGRWLRRLRIDELPELVNIARGEMAFVGPRPLLPATIAEMGDGGIARGAVRPGLTGWAQVNGNALLSREDKLALDLAYIRARSLRFDTRIVLRTVLVVLLGENATMTKEARDARGSRRLG